MNITLEQLPQCQATLHIEIPPDAVGSERTTITRAFLRQAKIPGYRPGKAPISLIEKRFAKDIQDELESRLLNEGFREGVKKDGLNVISITAVRDQAFNPDDSFSFTAELLLAPDFELPEYKGIKVEVPRLEVGEKDIDRALESLRERFADFVDVTDRPLAMGDYAVIDYDSEMDGAPLRDAVPEAAAHIATNKAFWVHMATESFLPGFSEGIVGSALGESRTVEVTVPEAFPLKEIGGKKISYQVEIREIKEQKLPEIDEALAEKLEPGRSLAEIREAIREQIAAQQERSKQESMTNQVVAFLDEKIDFDLPEALVHSETQRQVNDIVHRSQMSGMAEDQIREHHEAIINSASNQAKLNLKTNFILEEIAKAEQIEPTEQELMRQVAGLAARNQIPLKKFIERLKKNNSVDSIRNNIRIAKTLDFLRSNASVEEVDPPEPKEEQPTDTKRALH